MKIHYPNEKKTEKSTGPSPPNTIYKKHLYLNVPPLIDLERSKVDKMGTVRMMKGIVPEFKSKNSVYEALDKAE